MIYEDRVILDNPATQYFHQPITPDNLASHPKNPSICKFMIQLGRFDKLGSGVINIHKYLPVYANGAQPLFEDTREGFRLTLPLSLLSDKHDEATGVAGQVTGIEPGLESGVESEQVTGQVTGQVASLLNAIADGPFSRKELMAKLSLKGRDNFEKLYLTPALAQGLIEMTIPDKPNSRLQKYRLTDKGRKIIVALKNK